MSPEHTKDSSLFRLRIYIRPHLFGMAMFDSYLLLIDLVLDEVILHLNVLSSCALQQIVDDKTIHLLHWSF